MAAPRFFAPNLAVGLVELDKSEIHHLLNVRRLKAGDKCELFNGRGLIAAATVASTSKRTCQLVVEQLAEPEPTAPIQLTIAAPLPRAERARWLIEKLTELNVARFTPLITEHSVSTARGSKAEKHRQYVIDACKQSGRNTLMSMSEPTTLSTLMQAPHEITLLAALRDGTQTTPVLTDRRTLVVGPEGGFSEAEQQQLKSAGALAVSFGLNILRLETAAIAGAVRFAG